MQDKDFDQVFKERFEAFEVNPSDRVWQKITNELGAPVQKKRKTFGPYWMAAASVVLLTSAVLWLSKPAEVIKLRGKSEGLVAVNVSKDASKDVNLSESPVVNEPAPKEMMVSRTTAKAGHLKPARSGTGKRTEVIEKALPERISQSAEEVLLATEQVTIESRKPVIAPMKEEEGKVVMAQIADNEVGDHGESESTNPRIRTIGGLVNFVIAQVDKRDDKIIEFKDGDEGSAVSGINLGPLKFKSRNK